MDEHDCVNLFISEGACVSSIVAELEAKGEEVPRDAFGHTQYSSTEVSVEQAVVNHLNRKGLAARGAARGNIPGTEQRSAARRARRRAPPTP